MKEFGVFETVEEAIHAAKFAQECYENQTLETRRKVIEAILQWHAGHTLKKLLAIH